MIDPKTVKKSKKKTINYRRKLYCVHPLTSTTTH